MKLTPRERPTIEKFHIVELSEFGGHPVSTLERAISILGTFDAERANLRFSDIVTRSGLPKPTVHRLVSELLANGLLEREERGTYVVGLRAFEIGSLAPRSYRHRGAVAPHLERARQETGADVMLSILDGDETVLVEHLLGRTRIPLAAGLGERLPLHASAVGHIMLAFGPPQLLQRIDSAPLRAFTSATVADPEHLRQIVKQVRAHGTASVNGGIIEGALSVAAPTFGPGRDLGGALALVAPAATTNVRQLEIVAATSASNATAAVRRSFATRFDARGRRAPEPDPGL